MIKQALNIFFKQHPWAKVIRDYARDVFRQRSIPWELPVEARIEPDAETLVVVFPNDERWSITIKSEKL